MSLPHIFLVSSNVLLALVLCLALHVYRRTTTKRDVLSLPCPVSSLVGRADLTPFLMLASRRQAGFGDTISRHSSGPAVTSTLNA